MRIVKCFWFIFLYFIGVSASSETLDKAFKALAKHKTEKAKLKFEESLKKNEQCITCKYGLALIYSTEPYTKEELETSYDLIHKAIAETNANKTKGGDGDLGNGIKESDLFFLAQKIEAQQLNEIDKTSLQEIQKYIKNHQEAVSMSKLKSFSEALAYKRVLELNSDSFYLQYLKEYPQSDKNGSIRQKIENNAYEKAVASNDIKQLDSFMVRYPNSIKIRRVETLRNQLSYISLLESEKKVKNIEIEKNNAILEQKQAKLEANESRRQVYIICIVFLILFLILMALVIYVKRKDNAKIRAHRDKVKAHNDSVKQSLEYAKYIQEAILPDVERIQDIGGFVMFRPKDIVSGDFYWYFERDGKQILTAVDCTGHGVPGAFMSMIGNTLLNHIVKIDGITKPSHILEKLRKEVITSLRQNSKKEQQDGMDIALITKEGNEIEYAGAYNSLIHISDGVLNEIKADRMPIGPHFKREDVPFLNHTLSVKKGDMVCLFSDGFQDQFGGEQNKKYSTKRFKQLLVDIANESVIDQKSSLENEYKRWKGDIDQLDDVTIIGLRC